MGAAGVWDASPGPLGRGGGSRMWKRGSADKIVAVQRSVENEVKHFISISKKAKVEIKSRFEMNCLLISSSLARKTNTPNSRYNESEGTSKLNAILPICDIAIYHFFMGSKGSLIVVKHEESKLIM